MRKDTQARGVNMKQLRPLLQAEGIIYCRDAVRRFGLAGLADLNAKQRGQIYCELTAKAAAAARADQCARLAALCAGLDAMRCETADLRRELTGL